MKPHPTEPEPTTTHPDWSRLGESRYHGLAQQSHRRFHRDHTTGRTGNPTRDAVRIFAGRVSTEDHQDPEASRNWQLTRAQACIAPANGKIVAEYFDVSRTRALPWQRRPRAAELLQRTRQPPPQVRRRRHR
ncbi:hypothetical protein ACU686_09785 [Yinghuangia aomiensis]